MNYLIEKEGILELEPNIKAKLIQYETLKAEMELIKDKIKEEAKEYFENKEEYKFVDDKISLKYNKGSQRVNIDSQRLKKELPEVFEEYSKTVNVSSSITYKVEL